MPQWTSRLRAHAASVPCAAFDPNNPAEAAARWHYTNLQPMWASDNLRKSDSCPPGAKEAYMRAWRELMF